jgi:L-seryl-tRNA(Ser) seleniumtransferase
LNKELLKSLPAIDKLLQDDKIQELIATYGREIVTDAAQQIIESLRGDIIDGKLSGEQAMGIDRIGHRVRLFVEEMLQPSLRKAVNATGIILHTGLGRAMLPKQAADSITSVSKGYSTLAIGIENGKRIHRDKHLNDLICEITGAQAATVVNNNAAATVLILNTLAMGREVIISRGQLVEIGGSFRIPDVMKASGAILREVGTTNKTHLSDYENAINENTGAILRVHHSNYRLVGFASEPPVRELIDLAGKHSLPVIDDLGSGALVDLTRFGLPKEPLVQDSIEAGSDLACFSGDKLIGGPQSGIIVGKKELIQRIRKNSLARAFRIGKLTIAGLEATLKMFLNRSQLISEHPTYRMLSTGPEQLVKRGEKIRDNILKTLDATEISIIDEKTQMGSGSVPADSVPTKALRVEPVIKSADKLAVELRHNHPPIFARIQNDAVLLDLRTIQPSEDEIIENALIELLNPHKDNK